MGLLPSRTQRLPPHKLRGTLVVRSLLLNHRQFRFGSQECLFHFKELTRQVRQRPFWHRLPTPLPRLRMYGRLMDVTSPRCYIWLGAYLPCREFKPNGWCLGTASPACAISGPRVPIRQCHLRIMPSKRLCGPLRFLKCLPFRVSLLSNSMFELLFLSRGVPMESYSPRFYLPMASGCSIARRQ